MQSLPSFHVSARKAGNCSICHLPLSKKLKANKQEGLVEMKLYRIPHLNRTRVCKEWSGLEVRFLK